MNLKKIIDKVKPDSKEELAAFLIHDLFHGKPFLPHNNSLQVKPTKITHSFYVFTRGKHFNFIL